MTEAFFRVILHINNTDNTVNTDRTRKVCNGRKKVLSEKLKTKAVKHNSLKNRFEGLAVVNRFCREREGEEMRFVEKKNVYEHIIEELKTLIESGVLKYGDKLPSVRAYAVERKVNPNTVAKAYSVLEEEGYIRIELKKGAYVCYDGGKKETKALGGVRSQLAAWKAAGITLQELQKALAEVYQTGGNVDD